MYTTHFWGQAISAAKITSMLTKASLLAAHPKSKNRIMYKAKVERWAAKVPLGIS